MSSNLIFSTEVLVKVDQQEKAWEVWCDNSLQTMPQGFERVCYRLEEERNRFLELVSIKGLSSVDVLINGRESFSNQMANLMKSDWHRQVFQHVESVKPDSNKLPCTPKLQLRYIEVPLSVQDEYLEWRDKTIFDVIRNSPQIDCFLAYHTLFSTQPGVMFFSGFEGDSKQYMEEVFLTPRYKDIVSEAGDRYIAGGEKGLYTKIFVSE